MRPDIQPLGPAALQALVRITAVGGPLFLFIYGVLHLIYDRGGNYGRDVVWNVGHVFFLLAILFFGGMAVGLGSQVSSWSGRYRFVANVALGATLAGVSAFVWVILGDLFPWFDEAVVVPAAALAVGPLLFQLGLLTLLVQLAVARHIRAWSPALVVLGFISIAVHLDLLPVAAVLLLAGLSPLFTHKPPAAAGGSQARR
jgi:hypothetical protein